MKLLKIVAKGLPLFKDELIMSFYAQQRVDELDKSILFRLSDDSKFYLNCVNSLIGINASGKTTALKVILLALDIISSKPLSHSENNDVLGDFKEVTFIINFISDNNDLCQLETHISSTAEFESVLYGITEETFWVKSLSKAKTKADLVQFIDSDIYATRNHLEEFLPDDVSIVIAYNKKFAGQSMIVNLLSLTDSNILSISDEISSSIIEFLDPTIESLVFEKGISNSLIRLKFKKDNGFIILSRPEQLNSYLSSGTIKGIVTFTLAKKVLKTGGYLIVDELENHFNKEIVATLLRLFMDSSINIYGGVLIFSTHYPEILDEFERNDSIFITRNTEGITVENLNDILRRNDIKKSDAYQSGYLQGTTPSYKSYMQLKKGIQSAVIKGD